MFFKCCLGDTSKASCIRSWVWTAPRTPTPLAFTTTLIFYSSFLPFLKKSALPVTMISANKHCALLPSSLGVVAVVEVRA